MCLEEKMKVYKAIKNIGREMRACKWLKAVRKI